MTDRTCAPVDASKLDETRDPVRLGEALACALPTLRPMAHNVSLHIEHDDPDAPLITLGGFRSATAGLSDDTPIWVMVNPQHEFFEGLQIGGER